MELKYIWVKNHRILIDFQLNFSHTGNHKFSFNNNELILSENEFSHAFFGEKISSMTVIAGRNGAGKSSFCEVVLYATATLQESSFGINYIFEGIVCFENRIYYHEDIIISNEKELIEKNYELITFKESPFESELKNRLDQDKFLGNLGFIYYSNNFDLKSYQRENNLSNISTTYKIFNDKYYSNIVQTNESKLYGKNLKETVSQFNIFSIQEDYRNLKFILDFPEMIDFIGSHNYVFFKTSYSGNNKFIPNKKIDSKISDFLVEKQREILDEVSDLYPSEKKKVIKLTNLNRIGIMIKLYRLNMINLLLDTENTIDLNDLNSFIYEGILPKQFDIIFDKLIENYSLLLNHARFNEEYIYDDFNRQENNYEDWRFYVIENFYVPLDKECRSLLIKIIELEKKIEPKNISVRISNFSVAPYLSAGELSFLSIFARLYEIIDGYREGIYNKQKLIIFLDEPEIGFHPNWSKKLIKWLVDFLNNEKIEMFFQVILTTHSPYVLSDIPSSNVRLFTRELMAKPFVTEPNYETFGANIYDLLADSFFMQDGFTGEYAKNKIDAAYKDIIAKIENKKEHVPKYSQQEIKSIIEIIGEPLMQRQLSGLYDQAFESENLEIDIIQKQIKKLEDLRDSKIKKDDIDI